MAKSKCKHCPKRIETSEGIKTPAGFFCSYDHAVSFGKSEAERKKKKLIAKQKYESAKEQKQKDRDFRKRKAALKPASKVLAEAQAAFNRYIRIRDYKEPCIACGKSRELVESEQAWKVGGCWDAGHFMTRGAKGQLRFFLFNVHKQCKSCNGGGGRFSHKAATVDENYRLNLIDKIGLEKVEWLENNNDLDTRKKDIEYLNRIKRIFNKKYRLYLKRFRKEAAN